MLWKRGLGDNTVWIYLENACGGEVYEREAFASFIKFGRIMCLDSVQMPPERKQQLKDKENRVLLKKKRKENQKILTAFFQRK